MTNIAIILKIKIQHISEVFIIGVCKGSGGPSEIRTLGGITLAGFQDRCNRPTLPKIHLCS